MDEQKETTWRELKEFVNLLTEEQLDKRVPVLIEDSESASSLTEPFFIENDIYIHKSDSDDGGTLEELQEAHGEEFKQADYILNTPKGTPFLYIDSVM